MSPLSSYITMRVSNLAGLLQLTLLVGPNGVFKSYTRVDAVCHTPLVQQQPGSECRWVVMTGYAGCCEVLESVMWTIIGPH